MQILESVLKANLAKIIDTFYGDLKKTITSSGNNYVAILATFDKLGYFVFQHLVTLSRLLL